MNARSWWLMITIGLGILLNPLNSSMVSVAIPRLQQEFRLEYTVVTWIIFSFYIASSIAQPVMGKASDILGRRNIFLTGLVLTFSASILAPFSSGFGWLILFRIMQSIGTSMVVVAGMAIVRMQITDKPATALSILSMFTSGAAAIGPFVGGVFIHLWGWASIFYINIPFVAASFLLAWRIIPMDPSTASADSKGSVRQWMKRMDGTGILLFATGLIALLAGLLSAKSSGQVSLVNICIGMVGLMVLLVFVRHELRAEMPFIPLRTFADYPALTKVNLEFMLVNLLFYSVFFGLPSYLQLVLQVSEFRTGLLMLSLGLSSLVISPLAGRWINRSGPGPAKTVSAILMLLGSVWMITLDPQSPVVSVCLALAAFGISNGLNNVAMQAALFNSSPKEIIGVASGLFSTSRYFGTILSSLLTGVIMGSQFSFAGFRVLGGIMTGIAVCLVLMNWRLGTREQNQKQI